MSIQQRQMVAEALPASLHCSLESLGSFHSKLARLGQQQQQQQQRRLSCAVARCPAGSDLDFAVNGWVTRTVPAPAADADGFGSPQQQQQVAVEVHEWPSLEQQYLLADLADALEAKGLVQGQVGLCWY
jgi:hypothetical protein